MGRNKWTIEEQEAWGARVRSALADAGAIEECNDHEGVYIDQMDDGAVEEAYEELIAENAGLKEGRSPGEIKASVDDAMADFGHECHICDHNNG